MKDILDQFGRTIRSIFEDDRHSWDTDMKDAWQELNSYLDEEQAFRQNFEEKKEKTKPYNNQTSPSLIKDFKNLELQPGASTEEVKKAYKRLLSLYHPDRHAADPEKQRLATEITSKMNASYKRILQSRGE